MEFTPAKLAAFKIVLNAKFVWNTTITSVKGEDAHEIYNWAKKNHGNTAVPKWNFHKILINKDGKIEDTFASMTKPMSKKIIKAIEDIL